MSAQVIANPLVYVNNYAIVIVPNSFSFVTGKGDKKVSAASTGNTISTVYSNDLINAVSKVVFKTYVTNDNISFFEAVRDLGNANQIKFSDTDNAGNILLTYTMTSAAITDEPTYEAISEGTVEFTFMGDPLV